MPGVSSGQAEEESQRVWKSRQQVPHEEGRQGQGKDRGRLEEGFCDARRSEERQERDLFGSPQSQQVAGWKIGRLEEGSEEGRRGRERRDRSEEGIDFSRESLVVSDKS